MTMPPIPHDDEVTREYRRALDELNLLFTQLTGRPPYMDAQSRAYREMTPADAVPDEDIPRWASRCHDPLDPTRPVAEQLRLPEQYEAERWDRLRIDTGGGW